jgi:hypothetical protein
VLGPVKDPRWRPATPEEAASVPFPLRHPERQVRAHGALLEVRDGLRLAHAAVDEVVRRYVLAGRPLERVQWAGFAPDGALVTATVEGRLQLRDAAGTLVREVADVSDPGPGRVKSPEWARRW